MSSPFPQRLRERNPIEDELWPNKVPGIDIIVGGTATRGWISPLPSFHLILQASVYGNVSECWTSPGRRSGQTKSYVWWTSTPPSPDMRICKKGSIPSWRPLTAMFSHLRTSVHEP